MFLSGLSTRKEWNRGHLPEGNMQRFEKVTGMSLSRNQQIFRRMGAKFGSSIKENCLGMGAKRDKADLSLSIVLFYRFTLSLVPGQ